MPSASQELEGRTRIARQDHPRHGEGLRCVHIPFAGGQQEKQSGRRFESLHSVTPEVSFICEIYSNGEFFTILRLGTQGIFDIWEYEGGTRGACRALDSTAGALRLLCNSSSTCMKRGAYSRETTS